MIQTTADTYQLPAALPLEEGGLLLNAKLAYEAYGRPSQENVVVLLHDLTHSHRALGATETSVYRPSGWARELVGEAKVLSPLEQYVISVNLLGSPFGSTSPASLDEETRRPLGPIFPQITVADQARAVSGLLRGLGVKRVRVVVGVGLGGMVALRLASIFRGLVKSVIAIGAARSLPESLREQLSLTTQLLSSDPAYQGGHYEPGQGPRRTLRNLRFDYLLRSCGEASVPPESPLGQQLAAEADAFSQLFDANCYALLAGALGRADLGDYLERITARVLLVCSQSDGAAPPSRVREAYHLLTAGGAHAHLYELPADNNNGPTIHASGLRLRGPVAEFLSMIDR